MNQVNHEHQISKGLQSPAGDTRIGYAANGVDCTGTEVQSTLESRLLEDFLSKRAFRNAGEHSIPLDLELLPVCLKEYIQIAQQHTDALPGALLTSFLPVVAANIGNRVYIKGSGKDQYCHIWSVLAGPSTTSRKSTCLRLASCTMSPFHERLKDLEPEQREREGIVINSTTNSKMVSLLALNSNRLFEFHELGVLLKNSGLKYNAGMKENLTAFYDGDSKHYSNQDRTEYIDRPALSIVSASTPGWIYKGFETAAEQGSGFLQRFIYCVIGPREDGFRSDPEFVPPSYESLHRYDEIFTVFRSLPGSFELKMELGERRKWLAEHDRVLNGILQSNDDTLLEYAGRIYNNVFCSLLSLITLLKHWKELQQAHAEGRCRDFFSDLRVSAETVEEALYLCGYYLENAIPMINIINEGGAWHNERRVLKHLASKPDHTDTHSNIMNTLHIKAKDLQDCIRNLAEQEFVDVYERRTNTRASKMYRLLPNALEAAAIIAP